MADPRSTSSGDEGPDDDSSQDTTNSGGSVDRSGSKSDGTTSGESATAPADPREAELRRRVEERYDFDDFGPADMAEMTAEEWAVAFESESWITGDELLDRVADDVRRKIADREVFAVLEEVTEDGERRLVAYSDEGYAVVYPDGGVAGFGAVLRDVKPIVALCSMDSYTPPEPPAAADSLPPPTEVPTGTGEWGNLMLQIIAGVFVLVGIGLFGVWLFAAVTGGTLTVAAAAIGVVFLGVGVFLFGMVATARLSDRFRAEEYRDRLRSAGVGDGERPSFVPIEDGELVAPDERVEPASLEATSADPPDDGGGTDGE